LITGQAGTFGTQRRIFGGRAEGLTRAANVESVWGWLPYLTLIVAIGLFCVAVGDTLSRNGSPGADLVFWIGIMLIFTPIVIRLFAVRVHRVERIGLVVIAGLGLYLVKIWQSPLNFTLYDEMLHLRTVDDILRLGQLFQPNPILPVSPYYPGLEIVTDALVRISGLPVFVAGLTVVGVSRMLLMAGLYLIFEQASGSPRIAGLGAVLYMTNSNFVFWGAQFAYQSLALPLSVFVLYLLIRRAGLQKRDRLPYIGLAVSAAIGILAVVVTHHVTMYLLAAFLMVWVVIELFWDGIRKFIEAIVRRFQKLIPRLKPRIAWMLTDPTDPFEMDQQHEVERRHPAYLFALGGTVVGVLYMFYVATPAIAYLSSPLVRGIGDFIGLITGELKTRTLFSNSTGLFIAPAWERYNGVIATGLVGLGIMLGLVYGWYRLRKSRLSIAFLLVSAFYPASLVLRFTTSSWEISNRLSDFLLIAVSFTLAVGLVSFRPSLRPGLIRFAITAALALVVLLGGITSGMAPWERMPGAYIPSADPRSVELEGTITAQWALKYLGPDNRMAADRTNSALMGSVGSQEVLYADNRTERTYFIFFGASFDPYPRSIVTSGQIHYLMIDHRFLTDPSLLGFYYESGEPHLPGVPTLDPVGYAKLDTVPLLSRIYDEGNLVMFDSGRLLHDP